jgi:HD-like signal output (HDOD) protein
MPNVNTVPVTHLLKRLPVSSPVALKLMLLVADENVSFKEVAKLFSLDPVLAGQILQLANSGMYGRSVAIQSVLQAVAMLGVKNISRIAVTAALSNGFPRPAPPWMRGWWRHSIAAALIADHVGIGTLDLDYGYTAALLHTIGQLALYRNAPEAYSHLVESTAATKSDLLAAEREEFGIDHAELAGLVLAKWGLPRSLQTAVSRCHSLGPLDPLTSAVQAGCYYAESEGFGRCGTNASAAPRSSKKSLDQYLQEVLAIEVNRLEIEWSLA